MKRLFHYILLFFFLFVTTLPALQAKAKVKGRVIDVDGNPIELASVKVDKMLLGTITNFKGEYELVLPTVDSATLVFSCIGYKKQERMLSAPQGDINLSIRLQPAVRSLREVEVKQQRRQTTTMQVIDAKKANLMSSATGGIESIITTMAGVNSSNELSSQYSVRGGNFDENSVYVNGIEVYRPLLVRSGQQEGLSFINPDMVAGVSFSSGGFSPEYGDKMSSVLDITYRRPEKGVGGSISGSFLGASASVGHATDKFTQLHGIRYKVNSTLLSSLDTKGEYDPQFFDYQTFLTYQFNDRWDLSFLGNVSINSYRFIPRERETSFGTATTTRSFKVYFDGQESDQFRTYFGAATLRHVLNKQHEFSLSASAFASDEVVSYDISGQYWLDEKQLSDSEKEQGSLGVGTYHEHARNKLNSSVMALALKGISRIASNEFKYGINLQREQISDRTREWEMRDSSGYSLPNTGDRLNLIYSLTSRQEIASVRTSFFVQDTYKVRNSWGLFSFAGGLRGSYWSFNNEFILSPRLSASFIPLANDGITIRAATGIYYQAPFYKEFRDTVRDANHNLVVDLNRNIKSQRSIQFVLGGDYTFRAFDRPFKLTAELYYKKLDNLVPYEVDNVRIWYYGKNAAKGYATGVDLKLFGEFVPGTDSWISVSLMQTREEFMGKILPRPSEQRYSVALYFTDFVPRFPKFKFNLRAIWADGLPIGSPLFGRANGYFRTPPYRRVDIGLSRLLVSENDAFMQRGVFRHIKSIWIGLDVFNLLNISNVNSYYWVTDVSNQQYAVPNYLTMRQFNLRLTIDF